MEPNESLLNDFEQPHYQYVGFWPRLGALFIDGLILWVGGIIISYVINFINSSAGIIVVAVIPLLYRFFLEYKFGATVGKMTLGIKIVNYDLQPLSISNVVLRNIFYFAFQIANIFIEFYNKYDFNESDIGGFRSLSDIFTPQLAIVLVYGLSIIVFYIAELIFLLTDEKYRALHDRVGKTYVVKKTNDLITIPVNP
ncbi:MAG: RDD family protein [Chitinophagaceae bacterium]|nr:RDD family protein [Chitinophagaceae bacterium]